MDTVTMAYFHISDPCTFICKRELFPWIIVKVLFKKKMPTSLGWFLVAFLLIWSTRAQLECDAHHGANINPQDCRYAFDYLFDPILGNLPQEEIDKARQFTLCNIDPLIFLPKGISLPTCSMSIDIHGCEWIS